MTVTNKNASYIFKLIALILVYYVTARFGLTRHTANGFSTLIWVPTGIALASLLCFGIRLWPGIFIAAVLVNLSANVPLWAAICVSTSQAFEAVLTVGILQRLKFNKDLSRLSDTTLLILVGAMLCTPISATIGSFIFRLAHIIPPEKFITTFQVWWGGDCLANLIVTPLLLTWYNFYKAKENLKNKAEALLILLSLSLLIFILYSDKDKSFYSWNLQLPFLLFPFIIWAALRFKQLGATTFTFFVSVAALWGAEHGYGPFSYGTPNENILFLHTFLGVLAITGLVIAAMTAERIQAKEDLRTTLIELEKRGDHLDAILKGINDGITVINENDRFVYTNDIGAKTCGFASAEEMLKKSASEVIDMFELMDESGAPFPSEKLPAHQALAGVNNPPEVIVRFRKKGSRDEKWSIVKASPIFTKSSTRMAVSVFKDFTERKRLEDSIKYLDEASRLFNSSLDYEQTLARMAELTVHRIADWCAIDIMKPGDNNPHSVAVQHKDPEKLNFAKELVKKYPTNWDLTTGAPQVFKTGKSILREDITEEMLRRNCQDENHYQMLATLGLKSAILVPLTSRGKTFGVVTICSAESERHYTQEDLLFAEELARRGGLAIDNALLFAEAKAARKKMEKLAADAKMANQTKSLFLANMSHEIRTPLGAILGFNSLMSDSNLTKIERKKYTEIISRNGQQLTQLIDDILDLSKVEAGHLDVEILEISLPSLLTDITTLINQKAKDKGLCFNVMSKGTTPPLIYSDPTRLRQILINIIGNAIKFTTQGGVKVVVQSDPLNSLHPDHLVITVEDSGTGIPAENQSRLFEWFSQADRSTTRKFGGTGLGLALSRQLARALKGDIELTESTPSGTKFTITIANQIHEYKRHPLLENKEKTRVSAEHGQSELNGVRVLLVEDSADNRMLIECILGQRGVVIDSAVNGKEGVDKALHYDYDLVLMDIQMPIFDGLQATSELRKQGYKKPIVALTAHAMKEEREKTLATGCNAHLTKPIEIPKLLNIVAELGHSH